MCLLTVCAIIFRNELIFQAVFWTYLWCINKTFNDMTIKISKVFIMWTLMSYPFRSSKSHRSKRHHHYDHYKTEDLLLRRQKGSEVRLDIMMQSEPTEKDEAKMLHKVDLDEMASKSCLPYSIFSQNVEYLSMPFPLKQVYWWI